MKLFLFERMDQAEFIQHFYDFFHSVHSKKIKKKYELKFYPAIIKSDHGLNSYQAPLQKSTFDLYTYEYLHKFTEKVLLDYYIIDSAIMLFRQSEDQELTSMQKKVSQEYARAFIKSAIDFAAELSIQFLRNPTKKDKQILLNEELWLNKDLRELIKIETFYSKVCDMKKIRKHMRKFALNYINKHHLNNSVTLDTYNGNTIHYMSSCGAGTVEQLEKLANDLTGVDNFNDGFTELIKLVTFNTPKRRFKKLIKSYGK